MKELEEKNIAGRLKSKDLQVDKLGGPRSINKTKEQGGEWKEMRSER